jgi:glycerophosphoryl diester phosphodiesterase
VRGTTDPDGDGIINGIQFPTPSQPVEGFSGIVEGRRPGELLAMADNGFGSKANSYDFNIRAYYVRPDFKTARGGSGTVALGTPPEYIEFSDPSNLLDFPIVNEATESRVLTGADIDPESLQRGRNGDLWMGDEFGPWILHFDAAGRLLDKPFAIDGVVSPNNPIPSGPVTQPNSRGIEGLGMTPDGRWLYVVLEGPTDGDPADLRRIYEFDVRRSAFTGRRLAPYRVSLPGNMVADVQALGRDELVLIERDGGLGLDAAFRRVFSVDLRRGHRGVARKTEVVDLAAIPDPHGVSLPPIHDGDVGLGDPFRVTCESVEALRVLSSRRLLVGCDNNFPNVGRNPGLADDTELITIAVPRL